MSEKAMYTNPSNHTSFTFFTLKGISDIPELQDPIFILVLLIYLLTLGGNMAILTLVCFDRHLHTPMYFFLANLSISDMSSSTITLHKSLVIYTTGNKIISYSGCLVQMYMFASVTGHELFVLTAMSYDRYVAICNPLRYHTVMSSKACALLATCCLVLGFVLVIPPSVIVSSFTCYNSNEINHFFCDMVSLTKLTCSDTLVLELLTLTEGLIVSTLTPFLLTFISYIFIISTIIKIPSSTGRRKAFYTCSSHLTVVVLLYIILTCQYIVPISSMDSKKFFSLFNTAAVPLLNPVIYSLKNKDVKSALQRCLRRCRINYEKTHGPRRNV
ncbi:PREDICTED: olfactory receptor 6C74-like [Nanorana parkeri]|uniref:olfactory receptor 6C74-like n=1 Tax=Nanorana parkeri TaxID=125878 RepID=UPI000854BD85|nr:PREDICTED: olfactory receptor 6C74-like [Nanorana parkeri]